MMPMGKKKPLTIAMLGIEPKGKGDDEGNEMSDEGESEEEMPPGFLEAVTELRSAEDDESAAKALWSALQCAGAC